MTGAYSLLYAFENSVREFIDSHLETHFGSEWVKDPQIVAKGIRDRIDGNRKAEDRNRYHSSRKAGSVYYTTLGDLVRIVHSQKAWPVFAPLFPSDKWLHGLVEPIEISRNVVAHMNLLTKRDLARLKLNFEDWLAQVSTSITN